MALRSVDRAGNLLHTTLGRGFLVIVVTVLLGLILLVARRSLRERQP